MKHRLIAASALIVLISACTPVITHAPIKATPEETLTCAGDVLGSMGYQLLTDDPNLRAERAKHAAFGHMRSDYDRITVAVSNEKLHVRGETVAMGSSGGTTVAAPSKELRADVQRIAAQCGAGD